jgi:hypothetical protein
MTRAKKTKSTEEYVLIRGFEVWADGYQTLEAAKKDAIDAAEDRYPLSKTSINYLIAPTPPLKKISKHWPMILPPLLGTS